jgi:predicted amidohydrolase
MQDLRLTFIQTSLHWQNPEANYAHFDALLESIAPFSSDLILLPEMFNTGFSMQTQYAQELSESKALAFLQKHAQAKDAALLATCMIKEKGHFFNRLLFVEPSGAVVWYDKKHLFRMAQEDQFFQAGTKKVSHTWRGWNLLLQICYDLRFPIWSYNQYFEEENRFLYDVLIYSANFPKVRNQAWNTLLPARAIENSAYCVGINRIGTDGNGIEYEGESAAFNPKGETLWKASNQEVIHTLTLSYQALQSYRNKFETHKDWEKI